ncbi:MAG TPA: TPM domain-containing protein [Vicinamibacterales bacterium]|nr:TPM domain-containing protein [Vicinamibacterales bacterium]
MTARRPFPPGVVGIAFACVITMATARTAAAQPLPTLADAAVNDFANVVDPATEAEIDRWVRSLIGASKDYVYVVTVDTIAPYGSIEEYALRLFERARIGTREKDNGVLIVLAVKERRVRIETGYGLEEFITDGFAGETIRQVMLPEFREGRYGQGLLNGVSRVVRRIAEGRGVALSDIPSAPEREIPPQTLPAWVVPLGILILFLVVRAISRRAQPRSRFTRRRRGGTWSGWHGGIGGFGGGGFGGGFGGFGGGGGGGGLGGFGGGRSGGGGASGGW